MRVAVEQLLRLQQESGSIKKQAILQENKDNEDFRKLLYYALNPMLTYKISEQTLRTPGVYDPGITLTMCDIYEVCEALSRMKALNSATIYQVRGFLQYFAKDPVLMEFYRKLLSKTLRLGVTAKTVNKVIPGLIPEWEVQQAYPIESHPIKDGVWFSLSQKLNGVRATYYKGNLVARSGIPYEGLGHITEVLNFENDGYVFDGELTLLDKDAQPLTAAIEYQYEPDASRAMDIVKQYGSYEIMETKLGAAVEERAKIVFARYSAMPLLENRSTLSAQVQDEVKELEALFPVNFTQVVVKDIDFSDAFEQAVEAKMQAEQNALRAENEKQEAITRAEQEREVARVEAEAAVLRAQGEADALAITRDALENMPDTWIAQQYLEKWDGKLPQLITGDSSGVMLTPNLG